MLYSLGKVVTDDRVNAFHNDKHIYPVGYKSGRNYGSVQDPSYIYIFYFNYILIVKKLNIFVK